MMRSPATWVRSESALLLGAAALLGAWACQPAPAANDAADEGTGGSQTGTGGASGVGTGGAATGGTGLTAGAPSGGTGATCTSLYCNGVCADPFSDPNHCGMCNRACVAPEVCSMGECRASCAAGLLQCGQACVSTQSDAEHCGSCNNRCAAGMECRAGSCVAGTGGMGGAGGAGMVGGTGGAMGGAGGAGASSGAGGKGGSSSGGAGAVGGAGPVAACGSSVTVNPTPFGCELAWGANGNNGNRSSYLDFITAWVGYETNGGIGSTCDGCNLARTLQSTNAHAVFYAYFIGYQARAAGYGDCNTDNDGQNLCTHGATWIKANRARILEMYSNYARLTQAASPNKSVVWLLEGDFIQYTYAEQTSALTMTELATLTTDIVCAIKSAQPSAAVALNHSTWIRNPQMSSYFNAMRDSGALAILDLVWTTGMGNVSGGYFNDGDARNRSDGTYTYLSTLTGKRILVDTSFGATSMDDSWTGIPVATINQRIADGVVAVNVTEPPSDYQTRITNLGSQLSSVCR